MQCSTQLRELIVGLPYIGAYLDVGAFPSCIPMMCEEFQVFCTDFIL